MSRRITIDSASLYESAGQRFGPTDWLVLDQEDVDHFGRITRDEQWIHTDPVEAARGPFGSTVVHGYLTLSLCSFVLDQVFEVTGTRMALNYGLDRVRFPAPVPVGTRIRGFASIEAVTPIARGADAQFAVTIECEGASKPACVARLIVRFLEG